MLSKSLSTLLLGWFMAGDMMLDGKIWSGSDLDIDITLGDITGLVKLHFVKNLAKY